MKKFGLIGYPLEHSFSKSFFNDKFHSEKIDAEYVNFEIANIQDFTKVVNNNKDIAGLNVTIPYKEQIIPYLDGIDKDAADIGAVNVIKITVDKGEKKLIGFNSDIIGFTKSIKPLLKEHNKKALILGTGGASKAIFHGLKKLGIESTFVSRSPKEGMITYQDINEEIMQEYSVIVNCSPVGMFPKVDKCPDIPYSLLTEKHLLYDLIYNPDETLFMKKGAEHGATTKNGLEMLIYQAYGAWEIWNR